MRAGSVGRLGTAAAWTSAVCCLPYLVVKVIWTIGVPLGISDPALLHSPGWAAANGLMAALQLAGLLLVLAMTRPRARRIPAWLLLFPVWVGTGLLFQVAVGAVLAGAFSSASNASTGSLGGIQPWVFVMVYAGFAGQGAALAVAFACYVRVRWGRLLGERTGDVAARRTALAQAVAGMATAVAVVYGYWAAGGSLGLSDAQHPSRAMQTSTVAAAVITAVALLGLAGRWGRQTRFWVPMSLTWLGSGALAAFDGLTLLLNRVFLVFGTDMSLPGWSLTDTAVVFKVVTGLLAAVVGALVCIDRFSVARYARIGRL